jgi:hypothetical protein
MTTPPPNPWIMASADYPAEAAGALLNAADVDAPAAPITKSAPLCNAPHNSGERLPSSDAAGGGADIGYTLEPFSQYAQRRSGPKVSPPLPRCRALIPAWSGSEAGWPRGFDPAAYMDEIEPRPIFLDNPMLAYAGEPPPKETLLKLLAELAGA